MNRRTFLRAVGVSLPSVAVAGCLSELQLRTPVPIKIENETDVNYNLEIVAYDVEENRRTYEQAITAPPDQTTSPEHLDNADQHLRIILFDAGEQIDIAETNVRKSTQQIDVTITDDGLVIDVSERERSE